MTDDLRPPYRIAFDNARDPYTARNALGIAGGVSSATPPLSITGGVISIDLTGYQPIDGDLTAISALTGTNTIYYRSAASTWTAVTIGTGLTFSGGTLAASSTSSPTVQSYSTSSGTYTTPAGVKWLRIRMVGGGGGGAGSGTGSPSYGGAGSNGGNTTFGTMAANGGTGAGSGAGAGGTGGTAAIGSGIGIAIQGGNGQGGEYTGNAANYGSGGHGGQTPFGGGGVGVSAAVPVNAVPGTGSGGGGGGGSGVANLLTGAGGGAGGWIDAIIPSPAASYGYVVGAGGVAGTAGTSGFIGSYGAGGLIIVEEYYA